MHIIKFCRSLCLREKGIYESRGANVVTEFPGAVVTPMHKVAGENHVLYGSKPVLYDLETKKVRFLTAHETYTKEKVDALLSIPRYLAVGADSALDAKGSTLGITSLMFRERDNNLKMLAEGLFRKGYEEVVLFANNGIGNDTTEESDEDGVIRDEHGIAYATRVKGKREDSYQKGILTTLQNAPHDHMHVLTIGKDSGLEVMLNGVLGSISQGKTVEDLQAFRETFRQMEKENSGTYLSAISVGVITPENIDGNLIFTHYHFRNPQNLAGIARTTVASYNMATGLNVEDKSVKEHLLRKTAETYASF
ncbi:MAG: hypothetical protein ABIH49_02105 [archaeon]